MNVEVTLLNAVSALSYTYKVPSELVSQLKVGALVVVPVGAIFRPSLGLIAKLDATLLPNIKYKWLIDIVNSEAYFKAKESDK